MSRMLYRRAAVLVLAVAPLALFAPSPATADQPPGPSAQTAKGSKDDDAIKELRRLGAKVDEQNSPRGDPDVINVTLGSDWRGAPSDFQLLGNISTLRSLRVLGVPVGDEDLKQLDGSKRLEFAALYGTKVTADGSARLAKMHPGIDIDRRGNALLGVAGHTESGHVRVGHVVAGSPAEQAGLKSDDVIVKFGDRDVQDFERFTRAIGNCEPGDKITLTLRRGDETFKKEIRLGSWK